MMNKPNNGPDSYIKLNLSLSLSLKQPDFFNLFTDSDNTNMHILKSLSQSAVNALSKTFGNFFVKHY